MYNVKLENEYGNVLEFNNNSPFTIIEIQGLNPPDATINTSEMALIDGGKFNSSKVNMRQILLSFAIEYDAPANRIKVYNVLKSKKWIKFYYTGDYRDVFIEGYVQSISVDYFAMKQTVSVSILCPSPYFSNAQEVINELSTILSLFHFPFAITGENPIPFGEVETITNVTITNEGDVDSGLEIKLYSKGYVSNPIIYNYMTAEYIGLDTVMLAGDQITIITTDGKKSITLLRNGVETNIFNTLKKGSTWLKAPPGDTLFTYEAGVGVNLLDVSFIHYNLYEGV